MHPIDILSPSRPLGKSTVPATLVAPLEKKGQRISELLDPFRPQAAQPHQTSHTILTASHALGFELATDARTPIGLVA